MRDIDMIQRLIKSNERLIQINNELVKVNDGWQEVVGKLLQMLIEAQKEGGRNDPVS